MPDTGKLSANVIGGTGFGAHRVRGACGARAASGPASRRSARGARACAGGACRGAVAAAQRRRRAAARPACPHVFARDF
ncbi:hypothetical protein NM78_12680 [Burkholderia mallei]|nr:hypothetical protein NM78_12680 [Burkholderia mallei]ATD99316.1 hypothetical protein NW92_13085 [Burkholderia mallei]ATE43401.1 hypothetical protein NW99_13020 [Burkholderia mallei]